MIAIKRDCLNSNELQRVIAGRMEPGDFDSALSHLDDCDECRAAAENIQQDGDWIVQALASDEAADPLQAETACQVALWRMLETPAMSGGHNIESPAPRESLGPYRFIRALGAGGMGTVYLAEHQRLRRQCAVKLLPRERVDQPGWLDRFDREMTTIASLDHPNVVHATDAGQEDGWHYLVMEHLDGLDVGRIAGRMGTLDVADACEIVRQAAEGLAHVHAAGLVHRDIKPSNLMLTTSGTVKLLDLGLVLSGDDPLAIDDRLTTVGHLMGTMPYMAPEQLADSRDVDSRADLYSLGATLYRLISGAPPHPTRRGLAAHVLAITSEDAPTLDTVRDDVDPAVVALVGEMLARDPEQRPQSADDVAQRLEEIGNGGQLKRLLREAMRRNSDSENPATFSAILAGQAESPPDNRWRHWLMGAMAGFFLILAAVTIRIQTDVGDLVVKSPHEGFAIAIKQQDEVVETLRIEATDDNRITLRKGTYVVEIEGSSGEFLLSQGVVTIGRGEETAINVESAAKRGTLDGHLATNSASILMRENTAIEAATVNPQLPSSEMLYQAKTLDYWMEMLTREQDPHELGQAMIAVELLTRETEDRKGAAEETLKTARRLGGFVSSGTTGNNAGDRDPSHRYMAFLRNVFPAYLPDDGIDAISNELQNGNNRSRMAAIWLLTDFVSGSAIGLGGQKFPGIWMNEVLQREDGDQSLRDLLGHLEHAVNELQAGDSNAADPIQTGQQTGLKLQTLASKSVTEQKWLVSYVTEQLEKAKSQFAKAKPEDFTNRFDGGGGFGTSRGVPWLLPPEVIQGATDLAEAGEYDIPWELVSASLMHPRFNPWLSDPGDSFDAVVACGPTAQKSLLVAIERQLQEIENFTATKSWHPVMTLNTEHSVWTKALPWYADQSKDVSASLELLTKLQEIMSREYEQDSTALAAAIATLKARSDES